MLRLEIQIAYYSHVIDLSENQEKNKLLFVQITSSRKQISIKSKEHIFMRLEWSPVKSRQKLSNSKANDLLAQRLPKTCQNYTKRGS